MPSSPKPTLFITWSLFRRKTDPRAEFRLARPRHLNRGFRPRSRDCDATFGVLVDPRIAKRRVGAQLRASPR